MIPESSFSRMSVADALTGRRVYGSSWGGVVRGNKSPDRATDGQSPPEGPAAQKNASRWTGQHPRCSGLSWQAAGAARLKRGAGCDRMIRSAIEL